MRNNFIIDISDFEKLSREGLLIWSKLQEGKYKKRDWELKNRFVDYVKSKSHYDFKNVFMIQGTKRNKQTFDRHGDIEY